MPAPEEPRKKLVVPKIPAANLRNGLLKTPNQIICFPFCLTFHRGRENLWQYVLDRSCLRRLRILFRIAKGAATFEGLSIHKIFDCGVWHCAIYTLRLRKVCVDARFRAAIAMHLVADQPLSVVFIYEGRLWHFAPITCPSKSFTVLVF